MPVVVDHCRDLAPDEFLASFVMQKEACGSSQHR